VVQFFQANFSFISFLGSKYFLNILTEITNLLNGFPAIKPFRWASGKRTWRQRSYNGSNQWITLYKNTGFSVRKFPLSL